VTGVVHAHTINYLERDGRRRSELVSRGFFVYGLPRLIPLCRLLGHRPVVDGTKPARLSSYTGPEHRWVCCDRCGVRGRPQGHLDPQVWAVGDRYVGPWLDQPVDDLELKLTRRTEKRGFELPGPIDRAPKGEAGGQLVIGTQLGGLGWELKVGNGGSEHTLAAQVNLGWAGALYLHTSRFGTGIQRRLNPDSYESRLIGVRLWNGRLEWRLWSKRDSSTRYGPTAEPWWMRGEIDLRIRHRLLGPERYEYTDVPDAQVSRVVRMPEGDYLVQLKLQRCVAGRRRGRKKHSWHVDWTALGAGIPTRGPQRGRIMGSGVDVPQRAVRAGTWPAVAAAEIAAAVTQMRIGYGWDPVGKVPVDVERVVA
jgi:hypothetical protein